MTNADFEKLKIQISKFSTTRNFEKTDTPKNLAIALTVESSELLEIFQWMKNGELEELDAVKLSEIKSEVADVFIYLIALTEKLGINLIESSLEKMKINEKKYAPVEFVP